MSEREEDAESPVHDDYAAWLRELADGVPRKDLEDASGKDRQTLWRGSSTKRSERSIGAANAMREALAKVKGIALPPPIVSIRNRDDYEWYLVGRRLLDGDHDTFVKVLESAQKAAAGVEALQDLSDLGDPQQSAPGDTPQRWRGRKRNE